MSDGGDDDWFERGLKESEGSDVNGRDADMETEADADTDVDAEADGERDVDAETDVNTDTEADAETGADGTADGTTDADGTADGTASGEDTPFGDTGSEEDPFASGGDAFGGSTSGGDGAGGRGEGLFDDGFGEAMGGEGGADFEDEEFETEIPRLDVGIEGLDSMIQGGVPERHLIVTIGGPGTGKTTFGLQYLRHGLELDDTDRGVFITLEQSYDDIMNTANEHGWEFDRHEEAGNLAVVDLDPVEMANSLDNIRGELPELIGDFGADRFVLDSVSLLEMMYDDVSRRRTEVFDFTRSLKEAGVTTVLTSEANEDNPYASRHGIIEYLTDAVFLLRYVRSGSQETRLAVEIQKIRNANHSRETKPYDITMEGISVYEQANIF